MMQPDADSTNTKLRVLNLEDNLADSGAIRAVLEKEWPELALARVHTAEEFTAALQNFKPDVVLAAHQLSTAGFDGRRALAIVRQQHPEIPVIMLADLLDEIEAVELVKMGARDYVRKSYLPRLITSIYAALSMERGIRARKAAELALRESEVRYQVIMASANDAIVCIQPDGNIYLWNRKAEALFGYASTETIGRNLHQLLIPERLHEQAATAFPQLVQPASMPEGGATGELTARRKDGSEFPVELSVSSMNVNGAWHATAIISDITERKQSERRIRMLNHLYASLSHCNQTIVRSTNESDLYTEICHHAVQFGGFKMAWVGLIDPVTKMVTPVASAGEGAEEYLAGIQISVDEASPYSRGPTGIAIRSGQPYWCQDFVNFIGTSPWRERAAKIGWRSSAALPLRRDGQVIGAFTLYSSELNAFDELARNLLGEVSDDVNFALDNFSREVKRRQAEQALAESRNLLRAVIDTSPLRIFWKGRDLRYLGCNPAFAADVYAAGPDEVVGKDDYQLTWKDLADLYRSDDLLVMESGQPRLAYEERLRRPDGRMIWLRTSKVPLRDEAGEIIGVLGMYDDVTVQKQIQLALQRSEADLNQAQAVAQVGSWRIDFVTNQIEWSAEMYRIFGVPLHAPVDMDLFISIVHPDDRVQVAEAWAAAVAGTPYDIEHRVVADGIVRHVRERAVIQRDEDGRALYGIGTTQDITQHKLEEDELRKLSLAVDQSPNSIVITGLDANIEYVNDAFVRNSGYSREELIGQNPRLLHSGKNPPELYADMWAHLTHHEVWKGEFVNRRKDGSEYVESIFASPVRDADGRVTRYLGIKTDITERKRAEKALLESEEKFRVMSESAQDAIVMIDQDSRISFWNRAAEKIFGYQAGEALGQNLHALLVPPRQREEYQKGFAGFAQSGQGKAVGRTLELVAQHKDGYEIPIELSLSAVHIGGQWQAIGIARDISERKQAETRLRLFRALLDNSSDAVEVLDPDTLRFIDINEAGCREWGYSRDELLGMTIHDVDPAFDAAARERIEAEIRKAGHARFESMRRRKDGSLFPIEVSSTLVELDKPYVLGIVRNITERRQAEQRMVEQYRYVEGINTQLVKTNQQLEQAQNQLLQSEKMSAIGLLAAGVAHEINNPIGYVNSNLGTLEKYLADIFVVIDKYEAAEAVMRGNAALLDELHQFKTRVDFNYIREDTKALIAESHEGLERVRKIIRDLKDFSHVEADEHWVWADLHQGLESTLNVVWNELKYKCEVVKEYGVLPKVYCIPSEINQVFMNLLVNAAQAIEVRGRITLQTGQEGDWVWVRVSDTGKGIPAENIPRLFDPFFTTKPVGEGTGLGLSVSYRIMEKHHGRIEVQSEVGKGSMFVVRLPVQQPDNKENQ